MIQDFIKQYTYKHWKWYLAGFVFLLITNFLSTIIPLYIKDAIDFITLQYSPYLLPQLKASVWSILFWIIGYAFLLVFVRTFSRILIFLPGRNVEYQLRGDLFKHLLSLDAPFYRSQKIGDLMSRLLNDIQNLRMMAALGFMHIINTIMIYLFVLFQMCRINVFLTFLVLIPVPVALFLVRLFVKRLYLTLNEGQKTLSVLTNFFVESLANVRIIKNYVAEDAFKKRLQEINDRYFDISIEQSKVRSTMFPFMGIIGSFGQFFLFVFGCRMIIQDQLSIGEFVAFSNYIMMLAWPTISLAWIINITQRGKVSWKRLSAILNTKPQRMIASPQKVELFNKIEVRHLSYQYGEGKLALDDISFTLKAGQRLGIFGPSGSGKTTLVQCLAQTLDFKPSTIYINTIDSHQLGLTDIRGFISYVPQTAFLFSISIKDNIQFCNDSRYTNEQVSKLAEVYGDIQLFPNTFNTIIGERGVVLSGGQKGRLSLARALNKPHQLLILDDVLSAVDHETEVKLTRMIQRIKENTVVMVSHRVSALKHCDHILVLDNGRIVDQGSHDELTSRDGIYEHTWNYQQLESI